MNFKIFYEATRPVPQKTIDPALMTFDEYYNNHVNPENEIHPSGSYDVSVDDLNRSYNDEYPQGELVRRFKAHNREFELRQKSKDRWKNKYVKKDDDGGLLKIDGELQYMDLEDIKKFIPEEKRFDHQFLVYDVTDEPILVGNTLNEWGSLLVQVAKEYRRFGLGTLLVKAKRELDPDIDSGGVTPEGLANIKRVHAEMVREYIRDGIYSDLVKQGVISKEKVKEIVDSLPGKKKKVSKNLKTSDPKDLLVMTDDGQSHVIIYNKNIFDQDFDDHETDFWAKKFVLGAAMLGGSSDNVPYISRLHGPDKIKAVMIEMLLNGSVGEPIRLDENEAKLAKSRLGDKLKEEEYGNESDDNYYYLEKPTMDVKDIGKTEEKYRKSKDNYDEWYHRIQEMGDAFGSPQDGLKENIIRIFTESVVGDYPLADDTVSGLKVIDDIPNTDSIGATLDDYEILDGIREIPISEFDSSFRANFYSKEDAEKVKTLASEIKRNMVIKPLIVVIDNEGPYVLEGAHRLVALGKLGVKSIPAMIVIDREDESENYN